MKIIIQCKINLKGQFFLNVIYSKYNLLIYLGEKYNPDMFLIGFVPQLS